MFFTAPGMVSMAVYSEMVKNAVHWSQWSFVQQLSTLRVYQIQRSSTEVSNRPSIEQ